MSLYAIAMIVTFAAAWALLYALIAWASREGE